MTVFVIVMAWAGGSPARAADDTAQQLSNPIASIVSVPFENNFYAGRHGQDAIGWQSNIQPVIPFKLNDRFNLISRTILPVESFRSRAGLGDSVQSLFLSPRTESSFTFGVGPVLEVPTATNRRLGLNQVAAGPTAVGVKTAGPLLFGVLGNHLWSVSGRPSDRERINTTLVEPFVSYTLPSKTSFILVSESTYDWSARRWTVPVSATVAQLFDIGGQLVQVQAGPRFFARRQDDFGRWGGRVTATLVYPLK